MKINKIQKKGGEIKITTCPLILLYFVGFCMAGGIYSFAESNNILMKDAVILILCCIIPLLIVEQIKVTARKDRLTIQSRSIIGGFKVDHINPDEIINFEVNTGRGQNSHSGILIANTASGRFKLTSMASTGLKKTHQLKADLEDMYLGGFNA